MDDIRMKERIMAFLYDIKDKKELTLIEKEIVKYYDLEEDLEFTKSIPEWTDEEYIDFQIWQAKKKYSESFGIDIKFLAKNIIDKIKNTVLGNVLESDFVLGLENAYSDNWGEEITFVNVDDSGKKENISVKISFDEYDYYITILDNKSLEDGYEYTIYCKQKGKEGNIKIVTFSKNKEVDRETCNEDAKNVIKSGKVEFAIGQEKI